MVLGRLASEDGVFVIWEGKLSGRERERESCGDAVTE
jgi:hypothetical protein